MTELKNSTLHKLQGVFYYLALSSLMAVFCVTVYWQVQTEQVVFEVTDKQVTLEKNDKEFVVEINFCSPSKQELKINRYYENVSTQVMYHVPEGTYQTAGSGCFKTKLSAYTGRLDPATYKYNVTVSYELNPLRKIEKKVATVLVTVK